MSDDNAPSFERTAGLTLAMFAAVLALNDLAGGKYGDDEIIGTNEKANAYAWYQSKSIKASLAESHAATLEAMLLASPPEAHAALQERLTETKAEIKRYDLEKKEILKGSDAVGPEGQVLETNGEKGKIEGVEPAQAKIDVLSAAGDRFDVATLFLQMSLVLGSVSLVMTDDQQQRRFYRGMVATGVLGAAAFVWAMATAGGYV